MTCLPGELPGGSQAFQEKTSMARSALLNVMVQAAIKAGKSLSRDFGEVQNLQVSVKGATSFRRRI